jgi:multiple sugar transport system ATP-binding protein
MAQIQIKNLQKTFSDFTAVKNSSLILEDGKFVVLLGPSGCGKTTTLRMIAGLEYPTGGQILIDQDDVTYRRPRERDIAMVFQLFALYPHFNVRENLAFPLRNEGISKAEINRRLDEVAAILRIEHLLDARVGGLSGGDRQRVALGRAIVRKPKAFLMDEPLGTLDAEFRELMCVELRKLHDRLRTTTVFVTHDQNEAMALADHIVVMNRGEILQADTPEGIYHVPSCMFVASFIGRPPMNFIPVEQAILTGVNMVKVAGTHVVVPRLQENCGTAVLGIRPEHIRLSDKGPVRGEVIHVEYFGSHWIADIETVAGRIKAVAAKNAVPRVGEHVGLDFQTDRIVMFSQQTERLLASATTSTHKQGMSHG